MATVTPLTQPEGSTPSEIQIEIQNLIEGRRKLQHLIAALNKQRAEAELAFLRASSRDFAVDFDRSFCDGVFNKYKSVKQAKDQTKQRITALGEIANKIEKKAPPSQGETALVGQRLLGWDSGMCGMKLTRIATARSSGRLPAQAPAPGPRRPHSVSRPPPQPIPSK